MFSLFIILGISGCFEGDKLVFRINNKFSVYNSASCHCLQLDMHVEPEERIRFLKNVKEVRGNKDEFLVKTGPTNSNHETWILIRTDEVKEREDAILIEKENLQPNFDTIQIDFIKDFKIK